MSVSKNIVSDYNAPTNGTSDSRGAYLDARDDAQGLDLILTSPAHTYAFAAGADFQLFEGVNSLIHEATGATFTAAEGVSFFTLAAQGQRNDNTHHARVATVLKGANSVTLSTPSQVSRFSVGQRVLLAGFDLQGLWNTPLGFPSNPHFFEYLTVSAINTNPVSPTYGTITFSTALENTYKSTWPNFNSGSAFAVDPGGPATLYSLYPSFGGSFEHRGLTVDSNDQISMNARNVTLRNVISTAVGQGGPFASQNETLRLINLQMPTGAMEVDKLIDRIHVSDRSNILEMNFQSSSVNLLEVYGSTIGQILGTPKRTRLFNSTLTSLLPGAYSYGRSDSIVARNCTVGQFGDSSFQTAAGVLDTGGSSGTGFNNIATMSNGVITIPNSEGSSVNIARWAVPGTRCFWSDQNRETARSFTITDVTQDGTNIYVQTDWAGGFPVWSYFNDILKIRVHPAPVCVFRNCTGCAEVVDLSGAPATAALYEYTNRTYTGSLANGRWWPMWGDIEYININVITPYSGATGTVTGSLAATFIKADQTAQSFVPTVNLKTAGLRSLDCRNGYPAAWTGTKSGDSLSSVTEALWSTTITRMQMTNISGQDPGTWPEFSIEFKTDQGFVRRISCDFV